MWVSSLAGDYGFDPLGLGADPEDLKFFVEAEIQHARWAMLGMLGILGPELMEKQGKSYYIIMLTDKF